MALRSGHGAGRGRPHVEVRPPDELPQPVPALESLPAVPLAFRQDGKIANVETAKELGRRGGLAKARRVRLVDSLGLAKVAEDSAFGPYRNAAEEFTTHHLASLANVAGGEVGPGPSTMVASAALQLGASRYAFDKFAETADASWAKLGSSLANDSRQNLMAAYEIATREAAGRPKRDTDPLAAFLPKEVAR